MSDTTPPEARATEEDDLRHAVLRATVRAEALRKSLEAASSVDQAIADLTDEMEKAKTKEHMMNLVNMGQPVIHLAMGNGMLWAAIAEAAKE